MSDLDFSTKVSVSGTLVFILAIVPVIYFAIGFYFYIGSATLYFYDIESISNYIITLTFLLNIVIIFGSLILFSSFNKRFYFDRVHISWLILLLCGSFLIINNIGNLQLSRTDIKGNVTYVKTFFTSISLAFLALEVLIDKRGSKWYLAITLLVFYAIASFERESLLYFLVPLLLSLKYNLSKLMMLLIIVIGATVVLGNYKYFLSNLALGIEVDYSYHIILENTMSTISSANQDKTLLELMYFEGEHPDYSVFSYFQPVQLVRLFDSEALSNGGRSTLYYTGGHSGTGFSIMLESWLNLGPLGVFIIPFSMFYCCLLILRKKYLFLLVPYLVFLIKLQRSDFWPTFIIILMPVLIFYFVLSVSFINLIKPLYSSSNNLISKPLLKH